jgi:epsilon-lactone hydrolase
VNEKNSQGNAPATAAHLFWLVAAGFIQVPAPAAAPDSTSAEQVMVDRDATVHLPRLTVPYSSFASAAAKTAFLESIKSNDSYATAQAKGIAELRKWTVDYSQPALARARKLYPVDSTGVTIGGVYADVITPKDGIAPHNRNRVLINLHGGGFMLGARIFGALESMPVASLGKIKVITVDYREGPEYRFPAASQDVAAVYKQLLKTYKSSNIGIYGCSAGGLLTSEATAWIGKERLPRPGAIGIFCASAGGYTDGDSGVIAPFLMGDPSASNAMSGSHPTVGNAAYFSAAAMDDPMVLPIHSAAVLRDFPPTLIITSTRDPALSPAVYTHTQLVKLGVDAELHVWEGMVHGFFTNAPELPESRDAWNVVTRFFDQHLGEE